MQLLALLKGLLCVKREENERRVSRVSVDSSSKASVGEEARKDAIMKRLYAAAGLLGVYVTWAIMAWFIFTYGLLIYKQLGPEAQDSFSQSWGIGYALDNASEWQEVAKTAAKAALILVILDMLRITKNRPLVRGAHRLRVRPGAALQRRRAQLVAADRAAGALPEPRVGLTAAKRERLCTHTFFS